MYKNYFKVIIRNLIKHKLFSIINILGLTIGMTACLLILFYVNFEKSYDKFHKNNQQVYRLRYERTDQKGDAVKFASCCPPAGLRIRNQFPEVEKVARIFRATGTITNGEKKFIEEKMFFAESEFLQILRFKFVSGNPNSGINEINSAFISQSIAKKYFGTENPMGKTFKMDNKVEYKVTGIFEDIPLNSHIKFDILLSYKNLLKNFGPEVEQSWGDTGWFTYILFKSGADPYAFEKKLAAIMDKEINPELKPLNLRMDLKVQAMNDIHLNSHFMQEFEVNSDKKTVNILFIIALFIIIIAWVNYINLSTARSLTRAKEVGLRKVVGANRSQLMFQFLLETIVINLIAVLFSVLLFELLLPVFCDLTGTSPTYFSWSHLWFWQTISIMLFAGIILSGFYPILVMSSYKPIAVLKGKLGNSTKGISLRKALVVFQFIMSLVLITATITVFRQISFMKKQNLGISIDKVIAIRTPRIKDSMFGNKIQTFKNEILSKTKVDKFCVLTEVPGRQILWDAGGIHRVGSAENKNYQIVGIDYDFANVFDVKFVSGRNFSRDFKTDTASLILNETAVKWMGFKDSESAIGQKVSYWEEIFTIVGVMKNYHQQSLKQDFEPHIYRLMTKGRGSRGFFALKLNSQNIETTIATVQSLYNEYFPGNPFDYFFVDEYYNQQYKSDEQFGTIFGIFSFLAIFITCLGILGLASFMITQRTKEISVRKVLGANVSGLLFLIAKEFLLLIVISFIIAIPISYYFLNIWLNSFANRIDLSIGLFIFPLFIALFLTGITISILVLNAAKQNPIDNLRYE
ncbi:MAG: ABC transporter permease [Bacteroidetes bacterium]|nr:ABC transporter permease [Bacteroidota bacterium]